MNFIVQIPSKDIVVKLQIRLSEIEEKRKWEVAPIFDPFEKSSGEYSKQLSWEQAGFCAGLFDISSCVCWVLVFLRVLKLSNHSSLTSSSYRFGNRDRMFQKRDLFKVRKFVSGRGSWDRSPWAFWSFPLDLQSSTVNYRDTLENFLASRPLLLLFLMGFFLESFGKLMKTLDKVCKNKTKTNHIHAQFVIKF